MTVSSLQSGYNMIEQSSQMSNSAAKDIQSITEQTSPQNQELRVDNSPAPEQKSSQSVTESKENESKNLTDALVQLNQSAQYNRVGTNIVQKNQEMIGSLLDVRV